MTILRQMAVEKRVLNPANDSNDPDGVFMRNNDLMVIECEVKRRPSFYDYNLMLDEAYKGISDELNLLAANDFRAFLFIPGPSLECAKFLNSQYDLFATPIKFGIPCLEKSEKDYFDQERFRRYGIYNIPFSSLNDVFHYLASKMNRLLFFSQNLNFVSVDQLSYIRSLSGKDDYEWIKAPLDWHSVANGLCSSGNIIGIEFGSFDDVHRSLVLVGQRTKWRQLSPVDDKIFCQSSGHI